MYQSEERKQYKLFDFYFSAIITLLCLANTYGHKIIHVFSDFNVAASGIIFPLSFIFLIIISEVYGHKKCGQTIAIAITSQLFFIFSLWAIAHAPSPLLSSTQISINQAYYTIYSQYKEMILGSLLGISFAFYFFSVSNSLLKVKICKLNIYMRTLISLAFSKAFLVIVAYFINFWGIISTHQIAIICINTWILKMIMAIFSLLIAIPIIKLTIKSERLNTYDINVNYNPLCLFSDNSKGINLYENDTT